MNASCHKASENGGKSVVIDNSSFHVRLAFGATRTPHRQRKRHYAEASSLAAGGWFMRSADIVTLLGKRCL
jgi:hypothetical protein